MKPYIICHMMASVDGRIDCAMTEQIDSSNAYYDALEQLDCPTTIEGRVNMQMHFALPEPFVATSSELVGHIAFHKAAEGKPGYDVAIDTHDKLGHHVLRICFVFLACSLHLVDVLILEADGNLRMLVYPLREEDDAMHPFLLQHEVLSLLSIFYFNCVISSCVNPV